MDRNEWQCLWIVKYIGLNLASGLEQISANLGMRYASNKILISVLGGHVICNIINNNLANMLNKVSLLVFGIPSIILILGLSIIVALISTFTPVLLISIKKPVESIKSI